MWRIAFYAVMGGIAFRLASQLFLPSLSIFATFLGLFTGVALAIAIEQKMKREDLEKRARRAADLARERDREREAMIKAAEANGDFDRWKKDQ